MSDTYGGGSWGNPDGHAPVRARPMDWNLERAAPVADLEAAPVAGILTSAQEAALWKLLDDIKGSPVMIEVAHRLEKILNG